MCSPHSLSWKALDAVSCPVLSVWPQRVDSALLPIFSIRNVSRPRSTGHLYSICVQVLPLSLCLALWLGSFPIWQPPETWNSTLLLLFMLLKPTCSMTSGLAVAITLPGDKQFSESKVRPLVILHPWVLLTHEPRHPKFTSQTPILDLWLERVSCHCHSSWHRPWFAQKTELPLSPQHVGSALSVLSNSVHARASRGLSLLNWAWPGHWGISSAPPLWPGMELVGYCFLFLALPSESKTKTTIYLTLNPQIRNVIKISGITN